jgi:class 3 adenylate cyclase
MDIRSTLSRLMYRVRRTESREGVGSARTQQVVTVCALNIHGWVGICEAIGDRAAVEMLRQIHSVVVAEFRTRRGCLLSTYGDRLLFGFNTVQRQPDHVGLAVASAEASLGRLGELGGGIERMPITIAVATAPCTQLELERGTGAIFDLSLGLSGSASRFTRRIVLSESSANHYKGAVNLSRTSVRLRGHHEPTAAFEFGVRAEAVT